MGNLTRDRLWVIDERMAPLVRRLCARVDRRVDRASKLTITTAVLISIPEFALLGSAVFLTLAANVLRPGRRERLHRAPGTLLLRVAEFLCSRSTFEEIFEPTVLDFQDEFFEALAEKRVWKARWVRMRGYWSFFRAAGLLSVVRFGKVILKIWKLIP